MKSKLLYLALIFLIPCLTFYGNEHEVNWLWTNSTWVPVSLVFLALICIAIHLFTTSRNTK